MSTQKTRTAAALALAGILAVTAPTPSSAGNGVWAAAGIGFAAGVVGAAIFANRGYGYYGYYGAPGYYYGGYAPTYYAPYYAAPPAYGYGYAPYYGYGRQYYYQRRTYAYRSYPYRGYYRGNYYAQRYGYYRGRW